MKVVVAGLLAGALLAPGPALADLQPGAKAPDFTAQAFLAGKPFTYRLSDALRKGPVVLYFFPSAHTKGCNLEAHLFSGAIDQFKAQGASVIGVTAGKVDELAAFSAETEHCSGKFPVAADPGAKIAKAYDSPLKIVVPIPGDLSARTSYVIAPDGRVVFAYSDLMNASEHVSRTLDAVKAWRAGKR